MDLFKQIKDIDFNPYIKTELFLLLFINLIAPLALSGILGSIPFVTVIEYKNRQFSLGLMLAVIFSIVILAANINRIQYANAYKKSYVTLAVLNILAFVFGGHIVFIMSIPGLPLLLQTYYELNFGDGVM